MHFQQNLTTALNIQKAAELIKNADAIAIFAGAGMCVDSGLEQYRGNDGIWTKSLNIDNQEINYIELMNHHAFESKADKAWAFIGSLIDKYNKTTPHIGFSKLLDLVNNKTHFIITSNCDEHFQKAGFDETKLFECHGSMYYMQCTECNTKEIWKTPEIKSELLIPKCPNCGSNCRPNIFLFNDWSWISTRSIHQQLRYNKWQKDVKAKYENIVAIEIGAGETIRTIRNASENFCRTDFPLIRINPNDFDKNDSSLTIPLGAYNAISNIFELISNNTLL